jgi:hypothetical protein
LLRVPFSNLFCTFSRHDLTKLGKLEEEEYAEKRQGRAGEE